MNWVFLDVAGVEAAHTDLIGLAALIDFLRLNDHRLMALEEEQIAIVWNVAANEITEAECTA